MPLSDRTVEILEASYRLDQPDERWLRDLLLATQAAQPVSGMGLGAAGFFFEASPDGGLRSWDHVLADGPSEILGALNSFHASLPPAAVQAIFLQPPICATLTQMGLPRGPEVEALGISEVLGLQATDASGIGCCLLFALPRETVLRKQVRRHWEAVARHVRAALRLRHRLAGEEIWTRAEAVIDPGQGTGHVVHARGAAGTRGARETLRHLACTLDRVRTRREREDGAAALRAWPGLASGRWTLVEHFESDGRRYYVALRNEPEAVHLVKLTEQERKVVEHAAHGAPSKVIAGALDLEESTVSTHLRRAMAKLRVRSRAELIGLGSAVQLAEMPGGASNDDALLVIRAHDAVACELDNFGLTRAEKDVALGILKGQSNEDIARNRNAKPSTVANQVQSIFRKVGVNARAELVAHLTPVHETPAHESPPDEAP